MKKKSAFIAILMGLVMTISIGLVGCDNGNKTPTEGDEPGIIVPGPDDGNNGQDGPGNEDTQEKKVNKITIKTEPSKTEYWESEQFSVEGGVITVT